MKKTITLFAFALSLLGIKAQTVADFEGLTLAADTFYENHVSAPWQTSNATFRYEWDVSFGGFWSSGFAYTNKTNTVTGTYHNMYAAIPGKGVNNSNNYVTAWSGYPAEKMMIKLAPTQVAVNGFYITNSTYAYKTMLNGGGPARKFGDTLHTHSGMIPGDYPDWFKLTVHAYKNGTKKTDTVEFYLADYRFADNSKDYIVKTWDWVDCSTLGAVDSIFFKFYSSDEGAFGINNPTYFCMDNFMTTSSIFTGINKMSDTGKFHAYPNPFTAQLTIHAEAGASVIVTDLSGKVLYTEALAQEISLVDLNFLQEGIYFLELNSGGQKTIKKVIKN